MKIRFLAAAVLIEIAALSAQPSKAPGLESIRKEEMRADLVFLASDAMRGRLTDTPENRLAAEWIAARFERLGLKPAGDNNTYYQHYNLMTASLGADNQLLAADAPVSNQDFYPLRFSASGTARGELAFVGYGIVSPERGYDDYRGGVQGKIVLAIDHEPGENDPDSAFDGVVTSQASDQLRKTLAAQEKGAAGILFVRDVHNHLPQPGQAQAQAPDPGANYWPQQPPRIPRFMLGPWVERVRIPAAQITPALADRLLAKSGKTLVDLGKASESPKGSAPVPISGANVSMKITVERKVIPDRNVVALMEGSDPKLRDELVIVCAHYDHDGAAEGGVLNGADDDGSGTVGVMEIAEAYAVAAQNGQRPKRSVLFAAWNSEERGLFGAWAYTESPIRPLEKTVAVLNMDMIGRNEEVPQSAGRFRGLDVQTAASNDNATNVIGTTRSPGLKDAIERANGGIGLTLRLRYDNNISQLMRRSDHWPFLNRGVPAVWFHTGLHPDYHTPNDDADRINYVKMEKVTRLVHQASWDLAQQPGRPMLTGTR